MTNIPHPGSPEARRLGCTCAVIDNSYGRGRYGDGERYGWWMATGCPLHGTEALRDSAAGEGR